MTHLSRSVDYSLALTGTTCAEVQMMYNDGGLRYGVEMYTTQLTHEE